MRKIENSSTIDAIDHDGKTLTVHFKGGSIYDYPDFPQHLHDKWLAAHEAGESAGKWFHRNIKPHYEGRKREQK